MARRADRSSLVAAAAEMAEQARALTEEAEQLREEQAALIRERAELLALLTAVSHSLRIIRRRGERPGSAPASPAATVRAAASRISTGSDHSGGWRFDRSARRMLVDNHEVPLSPREFDLLSYLLSHPGQALSTETLLQVVWPASSQADRRTVRVHVSTLRAKLERFVGLPFRITTLHRCGYRIDGISSSQ
jgi:DNA-binding response OmpR family regulator